VAAAAVTSYSSGDKPEELSVVKPASLLQFASDLKRSYNVWLFWEYELDCQLQRGSKDKIQNNVYLAVKPVIMMRSL